MSNMRRCYKQDHWRPRKSLTAENSQICRCKCKDFWIVDETGVMKQNHPIYQATKIFTNIMLHKSLHALLPQKNLPTVIQQRDFRYFCLRICRGQFGPPQQKSQRTRSKLMFNGDWILYLKLLHLELWNLLIFAWLWKMLSSRLSRWFS